jgi:hypothetical protein
MLSSTVNFCHCFPNFTELTFFQVRFQAVRAVTAFIMLHEKEAVIQKHFSDLLPSMVQVFEPLCFITSLL